MGLPPITFLAPDSSTVVTTYHLFISLSTKCRGLDPERIETLRKPFERYLHWLIEKQHIREFIVHNGDVKRISIVTRGFEVGAVLGLPHRHLELKVSHESDIQLNFPAMHAYEDRIFGRGVIFSHCPRPVTDRLRKYVSK